MKRYVIWIIGFIILFLVDIIMEFLLFPMWEFNHTERNDIYFKLWWIVAGIWLVLGIPIIKYLKRNNGKKK